MSTTTLANQIQEEVMFLRGECRVISGQENFLVLALGLLLLMSCSAWGQTYDGPAELPLISPDVALLATPAPGPLVKASGNLQNDLNNALCGEILVLPAGSSYSGTFNFPPHNCDDQHWIWVMSNGTLPAEGQRVTPAYAGVLSLAGRPAFSGPGTKQMAQIVTLNAGVPVTITGDHYRLMGLEITRVAGTGYVSALVNANAASKLILDRDWLHGSSGDETANGIGINNANYYAVVNSYFSDIKCTAIVGVCVESHDIIGGLTAKASAGGLIDNNFLESSSIGVLYGGGKAQATPSDITVSHNHFFKPLIWQPGQIGFQGGAGGHCFITKNHFELKNAQRVLIEDNIFENTWSGCSDQSGWSILFTARNQEGNLCPSCEVTDVTLRLNEIKHVGGGFELGNAGSATGGVPKDGERFSMHDNEFDDIETVLGTGTLASIGEGRLPGIPPLKHVLITHNTATVPYLTISMGGFNPANMQDLTFTNNLIQEGQLEVLSQGGKNECAPTTGGPLAVLNACWLSYNVTANGFVNGRGPWPAGNYFPASAATGAAIVGLDGDVLGADQTALSKAISGVN